MKMRELGVASHPAYKISFYLDYEAMISVHTPKYGVVEVFPCFSLALINNKIVSRFCCTLFVKSFAELRKNCFP